MRWTPGGRSEDLEDRRGDNPSGAAVLVDSVACALVSEACSSCSF
jgi:hypothetical protein